tara:strand:- start:239 stop:1228 length:990 start_codon:yes stop_codon:yes gene_type:complete
MSQAIARTNGGVLAPSNFKEAMEFSEMLANSQMVPQNFRGKPNDIIVAVQWASEVGLSAMSALQGMAVINGKPSMYGDTLLALVTGHPQYAGHKEWLDGEEAHCLIKRKVNGEICETERTFSLGDAKRAGLANKAGPWKQYPKRMLQMRARGFALRDSFPDALNGILTTEEAQDYPEIKDITPPVSSLDAHFGGGDELSLANEATDTIMIDEVNSESIEPLAQVDPWFFDIPANRDFGGEKDIEQPTPQDWSEMFAEQAKYIVNDEGDKTVRRHELAELKRANQVMYDRLENEHPTLWANINKRYLKAIKILSAKATEEKGLKDANGND